jgi:predicted metalloprotease with PDZ domain
MVIYHVDIAEPQRHEYRVTMELPEPLHEQRLSMAAWAPGSYMVRDFGRFLSQLEVRQGGETCPWTQVDKNTWHVYCEAGVPLVLSYRIHAMDASVRGSFLDGDRGFFNGTSLCLRAEGHEHGPHRLVLRDLPESWQVATAMHRLDANTYLAADFDELVDHPFELGRFWRGHFEAAGVEHELVVTGALPHFDGDRLIAEARKICEAQIHFWHGRPGMGCATRPPFDRYVFLLHAVDHGHGGLEHRASTALMASRQHLPARGTAGVTDGHARLLGLISHEYFHAWNVKRMRPAEFATLDYTRENYTRLLWFFEGFTSYYDDLFLVRTGLLTPAGYVRLLQHSLQRVVRTPGRRLQSVGDASFDTWVKHAVGRQEPHTPNMTTSYYAQGALIALALDLSLRCSAGGPSLDTVMRCLWSRFSGGPVSERDIVDAVRELGGDALAASLVSWVHAPGEPPLRELLDEFGITWRDEPAEGLAEALGLRTTLTACGTVQVSAVLRDSAAERAGLSPGDEIIAVQGWRVSSLEEAASWVRDDDDCELLVARDRKIIAAMARMPTTGSLPQRPILALRADAPDHALARRRQWLGR